MTKRHRKKWVDALSLVLPVLLFFAVLNCFTTYLYYQDYQCKMDILTEVAAGAETTGMDVAAGWLKGNDHQANEQGKQLLEQYGYCEPLPVKRTVKKYKVFPVSSHMCCWPLFMRQDRVCAFPSGSTHPDYAAPV